MFNYEIFLDYYRFKVNACYKILSLLKKENQMPKDNKKMIDLGINIGNGNNSSIGGGYN